MTQQQLVEMDAYTFAYWAESQGYDYDDVRLWDMQSDLDSKKLPEGFEVNQNGTIPSELRDLLVARKAHRNPAIAARNEARAQGEQEARAIVAKAELNRDDWKRLVELRYATRFIDDNDGDMSASYSLTADGERLINPGYREHGTYADQVGIDGE